MAQGSTFTGSKGDCKVYDSGCAAGTTDYYTGWYFFCITDIWRTGVFTEL